MIKILLLGKEGSVGSELQRALAPLGELVSFGRAALDITCLASLQTTLHQHRPHFVVNAAAYTQVDKAESEPEKARLVNETAVRALASLCAELNACLIHYSTNYVFDGHKPTPYLESDTPKPLCVYGQTKLAGERAIAEVGCKHLILRCGWIYGPQKTNFPLTILKKAMTAEKLEVIHDSRCAPTSAYWVAHTTALLLYRLIWDPTLTEVYGLYHLVASGDISWYDYAQYIIRLATEKGMPIRLRAEDIVPVSLNAYPTPAKRPRNGHLNCQKLSQKFNIVLPNWQSEIDHLIETLSKVESL